MSLISFQDVRLSARNRAGRMGPAPPVSFERKCSAQPDDAAIASRLVAVSGSGRVRRFTGERRRHTAGGLQKPV